MKKRLLTVLLSFAMLFSLTQPVSAEEDVNIVSGLPYTYETGVGIEYSYGLSGSETPASEGKLTDGVRAAQTSYSDAAWNHSYRGYTRSVVFQLPEEYAVTGFSLRTLRYNTAGVGIGSSYQLAVSENGTDYMTMAVSDTSAQRASSEPAIIGVHATAEGSYKANYVKLTFDLEVGAYIDEIEIYGHKPNGSEKAFIKDSEKASVGAYDAGVEGCRDMVLLYCGYPGEYAESFVQNTEEEMLYYCGYVSNEGKILDTMFDSVLFSALGSVLPSGNHSDSSVPGVALMSDWNYFLDSIFDETYNCGAIEKALDKVKQETGKSDYTMQIVINMPYPHISGTAFGDIDGDGEDEFCRNQEDQLALFAWFMDETIARMNERGYQNITLGGFYWGAEGISITEGDEGFTIVEKTADLVHERNAYFFWIPFLYGNGFDRAKEMGFDGVMMQPNYPFLDYAQEKMFYEFNDALLRFGLSSEIEIHWNALTDEAYMRRYYAYLDAGATFGFMENGTHSYYQNSNPGTYYQAAISNNTRARAIYDDTYAFIKHTYKAQTGTLSGDVEQTVVTGKKLRGTIKNERVVVNSGSLAIPTYQIAAQPEHGELTLNATVGSYLYIPNDGYVGEDSFSVVYQSTFTKSNVLTIDVSVTETAESVESGVSESAVSEAETSAASEETSDAPTEKGTPWLWIGIAAGAVVILLAVVIIVMKKRKK